MFFTSTTKLMTNETSPSPRRSYFFKVALAAGGLVLFGIASVVALKAPLPEVASAEPAPSPVTKSCGMKMQPGGCSMKKAHVEPASGEEKHCGTCDHKKES